MNRVKFGDVVQEIKINVDRTTDDHEYFIAGEHMDSSNIHITRRGRFSESDVGPAFIRLFRPGQVLYGSRRTYLRKVAVADFEGITSNTTFVLETKDSNRLLQELLPYIMLTDRFSEYAINNSKGSTNPYILFKDLAAYEFDLPTIEEQRQLMVLLSACDRAKEAYKRLLKQTDEVVKSQFIEMFGDYISNSKGWPIAAFDEFASIDANMTTDYEKYADYPHIGIDSIEKDTGILSGYRTVKEDNVISGKYVFTKDHIIYSKIRPNLNKVALPDFDGLCSADAYPILPKVGKANRIYLAVLLRSEFFLSYILGFSARSNMPKVNRQQIAGFKAPLPPLSLQNQFAVFYQQSDKSKFVALQTTVSELYTCMIKSLSIYGGQSYAE